MKKQFFIFILLYSAALGTCAQKFEIISGSPKPFKNARFYYLTFDYADLKVGKFENEQAYIDYMKDDAERRKKGSSEQWLKEWIDVRANTYQPRFVELFNKQLAPDKITGEEDLNGQNFELNLHTTYIEPGFNRNMKRAPAKINVIVTITEINNPDAKLVLSGMGITGKEVMGFYFPELQRIGEAYAKCGKELAKYIRKVIY